MTLLDDNQMPHTISALRAALAFATLAATSCANPEPMADFIPSFEREWWNESTDELYSFTADPSGNLTGHRITTTGQQHPFTGTYEAQTLTLQEPNTPPQQGQFLDPNTIQLTHPKGQQTLHRTDD